MSYKSSPAHEGPQFIDHGGLCPVEQDRKELWSQQQNAHLRYASNPEPEDKKGRPIGGLKPWTFWTLIALISVVVIAASVGGAVAGSRSGKDSLKNTNNTLQSSGPWTSSVAVDATLASSSTRSPMPTPTPSPLSCTQCVTTDCPKSNGTSHTPKLRNGKPGSQTFNKRCGAKVDGGKLFLRATVVDFDSCIALCANWNVLWPHGPKCTAATFSVQVMSASNCWVNNGTKFNTGPDAAPSASAMLV
ncbi:hypothetical protein CC86DRAFT_425150 [Ophiobolus disseminans]|uniref:Apple domain-containing protein n=1 Tax=Ophiobolus disseminans TaxID=1469910 RepID=A0A6A7AHL1_9PLEO|nr:hypothetical protein CC86DRAFT_425150 [Ophiobolus disseminans]